MVPWPRSLSLVSHPGALEGTLWVWFGPLPPRAVRAYTLTLAGTVGLGSVVTGAAVSAALAEAGWVVAAVAFPVLAFLLLSVALLAALRLFRGRPEGFRITRNQLRVGRFSIPLDAIRGVRAFERPARLQSLGLVVDSDQGELWLEVNPFAHTLADLQWLAARMGEGPDADERAEVPADLLALRQP